MIFKIISGPLDLLANDLNKFVYIKFFNILPKVGIIYYIQQLFIFDQATHIKFHICLEVKCFH